MIQPDANIIEFINYVKQPTMMYPATVIGINEATNTIDVQLKEDEEQIILGVLLHAKRSVNSGYIEYPVEDSDVWVSKLDAENWHVVLMSEIEDIKYVVDNNFDITATNDINLRAENDISLSAANLLQIKTDNENLKAILTELIAAIEVLTVNAPNGPTSPPLNKATFTAIKNRIPNLLK